MKILAAALGAATAIALLSGCAYDRYDHYAYGYGPRYAYGYGPAYYDGHTSDYRYGGVRHYDRYAYGYGNGNANGSYYTDRSYRTWDGSYSDCWVGQSGGRQCVRH
jgi:hypothetical protein